MADTLRDYQTEAVNGAREAVRAGESPVIVIPTGGGKTHVGVSIVNGAVSKGNRVVWLAHREELIDQASERLDRFGVHNGVLMGTRPADTSAPVQVASVATLVKREKPAANVIILDEAHHVRAATYLDILAAYPGVPVIGLTATPVRLDGRGLGDVFDRIVAPVSCMELVERGYLMEPRYYAPSQPDFNGIRKVGGDYSMGGASKVMMERGIMGNVVKHYTSLAAHAPAVVFACNIRHSLALVDAFKAAGYKAAHLDGTTPTKERAAILADLRDGKLEVVSNVNVLTEGWDLPRLRVCIVARPTESWSLHLQMLGRVMRVEDGKESPIVIDHAGNLVKHGFPTDRVEFDLSDASRKTPGPAKHKVCKACLAVVPVAASTCPECGYAFPRRPRGELAEVDGDLQEVKPSKPTNEDKERLMDHLLGIARGMGYKRGWASNQYKAKMHVLPRGSWYRPLVDKHLAACVHVKREGNGGCRFCNEGNPDKPKWAGDAPRW